MLSPELQVSIGTAHPLPIAIGTAIGAGIADETGASGAVGDETGRSVMDPPSQSSICNTNPATGGCY